VCSAPSSPPANLDGAVSWGLVTSAIGIGLACGSITSLLFPPARVGLLMCATPIPEALLMMSMASGAPLLALAGAGALTGAAGTLQLITWTSYLQEAIPTEQLSRIMAANAMIGTLLVPVSYAVAGPLAEIVGVRAVLGGVRCDPPRRCSGGCLFPGHPATDHGSDEWRTVSWMSCRTRSRQPAALPPCPRLGVASNCERLLIEVIAHPFSAYWFARVHRKRMI
jgi:hypothetical protein